MVHIDASAVSSQDVSADDGNVPSSLPGVHSRTGGRIRPGEHSPSPSPTEVRGAFRLVFPAFDFQPLEQSPTASVGSSLAAVGSIRKSVRLSVITPQSCTSNDYKGAMTPGTPDPARGDFRLLEGDVRCILFDFDGTLTATPGNLVARQSQKTVELCDRAAMLAPYLRALKDFGILLGIISKSTEATVRNSLQAAGLSDVFSGPILGKAVGLEGKMGFIEDLAASGALGDLGHGDHEECLSHILLVDDDVHELDRARDGGVQTFPAPAEGGLQDDDFLEIFAHINLAIPGAVQQGGLTP